MGLPQEEDKGVASEIAYASHHKRIVAGIIANDRLWKRSGSSVLVLSGLHGVRGFGRKPIQFGSA